MDHRILIFLSNKLFIVFIIEKKTMQFNLVDITIL